MKIVSDHTFTNQEVQMDGTQFVRCVFKNCLLIYAGGVFTAMETDFNGSKWVFDGPAQNTINVFKALYHGAGVHGRSLVEGTFQSIKDNKFPLRPDITDATEEGVN
ncbi:MAG: hypothetical protein M3Y84_06015 [Acidobacteriota bacterium]|nr:hypothetical protein [Acidobacteriota bacterium]